MSNVVCIEVKTVDSAEVNLKMDTNDILKGVSSSLNIDCGKTKNDVNKWNFMFHFDNIKKLLTLSYKEGSEPDFLSRINN